MSGGQVSLLDVASGRIQDTDLTNLYDGGWADNGCYLGIFWDGGWSFTGGICPDEGPQVASHHPLWLVGARPRRAFPVAASDADNEEWVIRVAYDADSHLVSLVCELPRGTTVPTECHRRFEDGTVEAPWALGQRMALSRDASRLFAWNDDVATLYDGDRRVKASDRLRSPVVKVAVSRQAAAFRLADGSVQVLDEPSP